MKLCVIGCGWVAASNHGPALARYAAEHPDVELSACCDVLPERAESFRAQFGFRRAYTHWQTMIEKERPDAACLLVPPDRMGTMASELLERGTALLMEKPPGLTLEEVKKIHAAAVGSGTPHLVAFNRRFTPLVRSFREAFSASFAPEDIQVVQYEMVRIGRTDPDFSTTAVHGIDTVAFLSGAPYRQIEFRYQPMAELGENVANVFLDGCFTSGARVQLVFLPVTGVLIERAAIYLEDTVFFLELPLSGGSDWPGRLLQMQRGKVVSQVTGPQAAGGTEDWLLNGFYDETAAFLNALRAGQTPPSAVGTAVQTVALMQALRERRLSWIEGEG
jgi:myo-inositol 2-dehydrogenase / D-chiro-inositol 1-dehydrogenase